MNSTQVASLYVGLNIALLVVLAVRVMMHRRSAKVSVGDGGNDTLTLRIRTHGNASEHVPAFMIGLFMTAVMGSSAMLVHVLGASFTAGRLLHAAGLSASVMAARALGMLLTWVPMLVIAGLLVWQGLF
ncbi:MAPEG family protein [Hyphomonas sp.]|uniref:MAPEG family protein n=1 Tax=Hyphomonas sp. TaxID=87 RepID=UPI0035281F55